MVVLRYSLIYNDVLQGQALKFYLNVIYIGACTSLSHTTGKQTLWILLLCKNYRATMELKQQQKMTKKMFIRVTPLN